METPHCAPGRHGECTAINKGTQKKSIYLQGEMMMDLEIWKYAYSLSLGELGEKINTALSEHWNMFLKLLCSKLKE